MAVMPWSISMSAAIICHTSSSAFFSMSATSQITPVVASVAAKTSP